MADGFEKSRPWICVGRQTLWFVGALAEVLGKIFRFQPLIDRSMARSATHREIYSSHKIQHTTGFTFTPVSKCIADVCSYLMTIAEMFLREINNVLSVGNINDYSSDDSNS